jgi:hypothetical protein
VLCRPSLKGHAKGAPETEQARKLREGGLRRRAGPTSLHLGAKGAPLHSKKIATKCRECNVYLHHGLEGTNRGVGSSDTPTKTSLGSECNLVIFINSISPIITCLNTSNLCRSFNPPPSTTTPRPGRPGGLQGVQKL